MERYINPPERSVLRSVIEEMDPEIDGSESAQFPRHARTATCSVSWCVTRPLEDWQADVLSIIREEAYYFRAAGPDQDHERGLGHLLALAHDDALSTCVMTS